MDDDNTPAATKKKPGLRAWRKRQLSIGLNACKSILPAVFISQVDRPPSTAPDDASATIIITEKDPDTPRSEVSDRIELPATRQPQQEMTTIASPAPTIAAPAPTLTRLQKTLLRHGYKSFTIRPLVYEDYGPKLLGFMGRAAETSGLRSPENQEEDDPSSSLPFAHKNHRNMLSSKEFHIVLLERQRTRHYTLVAICGESQSILAIGSVIILSSLLKGDCATAFIDSVLVDPMYSNTTLSAKMIIRLTEVAQMVATVSSVYTTLSASSADSTTDALEPAQCISNVVPTGSACQLQYIQ